MGAKIYNRMLLDRLRPHTDPKLRNNQNGFRKGRPKARTHIGVKGSVLRLVGPVSVYCDWVRKKV